MDELLLSFYRKVGTVYRITQNHLNEQLMRENLSFNEYIVLNNINKEGIAQEDIVKILVTDKAQIARLLKSLEEKKYIIRKQVSTDKRLKQIFLTENGAQKLVKCVTILNEWNAKIIGPIDQNLLYTADEALTILYNNTLDYYYKK